MNYISELGITKAYIGDVECTSDNVFIGTTPLIGGGGKLPYLCFTAIDEVSTLSLDNYGGNAPVLYYSTDSKLPTEEWEQWDYSQIELQPGESVYMYGNNHEGFSTSFIKYSTFVMSGKIAASGNIQSLISIDMPDTIPSGYCYYYMFRGCTSLVTAPELPATTLADSCYVGMFSNCRSLVEAPELPATTLAQYCYYSMFSDCTSLVTAPELPATTLTQYCYSSMFSGCSSLVTAPELPATTLVDSCYNSMFHSCTNLKRIEVGFTSWTPSNSTTNWVYNVPTSGEGVFIKPSALSVKRGNNFIPTNWQVQNK